MTIAYVLLYLVAVIAVVAMWRGLWAHGHLPLANHPKRSNWVSFIIGFV